jgi:hypothetical protein
MLLILNNSIIINIINITYYYFYTTLNYNLIMERKILRINIPIKIY